VDGGGTDASRGELLSHEVRVGGRDAEGQRRSAPVLTPGLENVLRTSLCRHRLGERQLVEATCAPRDGGVVDGVVADADVAEGHQIATVDAIDQPDLEDEVVAGERE
jgi:hypothetical protein